MKKGGLKRMTKEDKKKLRETMRMKKQEDLEFIRKVTLLTNINTIAKEINVDRSNVVSGRAKLDTVEYVKNKLEENLRTILGIDENANNN